MPWNYQNAYCSFWERKISLCHLLQFSAHFRFPLRLAYNELVELAVMGRYISTDHFMSGRMLMQVTHWAWWMVKLRQWSVVAVSSSHHHPTQSWSISWWRHSSLEHCALLGRYSAAADTLNCCWFRVIPLTVRRDWTRDAMTCRWTRSSSWPLA